MEAFRAALYKNFSMIPKDLIPMISIGLVALVIILFLLFFVVCAVYISAQSRPKPPVVKSGNAPAAAAAKDKKAEQPTEIKPDAYEELPLISGRIGELLTLWGIFKTGPIVKAFLRILEIMRNSSYELKWRYKFPCYMMIGPDGSGKTTLLQNLNFESLTSNKSNTPPMWQLFKQGAIFEFPRVESAEEKSKLWTFISQLFMFIRPRRPLDGIIVTLPVTLFTSNITNIEHQAKEMFERIFEFQHNINFKLPIYIIITKTDVIPGFQEFVHLLHPNSRQQIFGWSSPYAIDIAFSVSWVDEIFTTFDDGIRKALFYFTRNREVDENLEKAILFESHFEAMKPALSNYLRTMFRVHNPQDGLLLRGVYLVGKQKEINEPESLHMSALTPGVNIDASLNYLHNDELYFVHDLFKEKIFKECNIAYPIEKNLGGVSSTEYRNKLIFVASASVISLGWFWGNSNIRHDIHNYLHSMQKVKRTLSQIQYLENTIKGENEQVLIQKHAATLLRNMPVVKLSEFFSIFVPQSWFFGLKREVKSTIEIVLDSVITKSMYLHLSFNAKSIFLSPNVQSKRISDKKDIFDVENFESFKALQKFIDQINNVKDICYEYNSVRDSGDSGALTHITEELFHDKFEATDNISRHTPNKKIIPPKFNLSDFNTNIENSLNEVFSRFIQDALDPTVAKITNNVANDIIRLKSAGEEAKVPYSTEDLAKLFSKIELLEDIFKNRNFAWVKSEKFAPTFQYKSLVRKLQEMDVVSSDYIQNLSRSADIEFQKYKDSLETYATPMTGKLIQKQNPSEGLLVLKSEIKSMLDQPFVCAIPKGRFIRDIPSDKMLIWDAKRLRDLSNLIDKYNDFAENMPEGMRAEFFDIYKTIAKKCMYPTIKVMLGNSEILEDLPMGTSRILLESAYKKQAQNVRNVSVSLPKIIKVVDEFIDEENLKDFGFSDLVIEQYVSLLEKIDALFNLEKPYSTSPEAFDNWDGNGNPKFMNMGNQENVRQYLSAQFDRIKFLAKDLAEPIIDLLTIPLLLDKIRDKRLVTKWKGIINSINDYENQKPGNSIAALESFITENLARISLDSVESQGEIREISQQQGDYFLDNRSNVAKSLLNRADIVQYEKAVKAYNKIEQFFNQNLAHKFPFGNTTDDAAVKDIENFISLYDKTDKTISQILTKHKTAKNINQEALDFLKSLETLIPFLKNWIAQTQNTDPNTCPICFQVLLRPFPNMEYLTSSVVDRMLLINNIPVNDNTNGVFFNNDKVMAMFGWVASADEKPDEKATSGHLRVEDTKAAFSYEGRWGMFRLIETHKMDKHIAYPNGVVLLFEVPVVSAEHNNEVLKSKMVFKIVPQLRDGDKFTPISWPIFPERCPTIHNVKDESSKTEQSAITEASSTPKLPGVDVSFDE